MLNVPSNVKAIFVMLLSLRMIVGVLLIVITKAVLTSVLKPTLPVSNFVKKTVVLIDVTHVMVIWNVKSVVKLSIV